MMISRRNFLAVAGAAAAAAALTACGGSSSTSTASSAAASSAASTAEGGDNKIVKVALTCDTGTIDDESFNQACWTAVSGYMGDDCQYYIPEADASDEDRETMIRQAVNDGDVVICDLVTCTALLWHGLLTGTRCQVHRHRRHPGGDIACRQHPRKLLPHHLC